MDFLTVGFIILGVSMITASQTVVPTDPEPLRCYTCGRSTESSCEADLISTKTCLSDQVCVLIDLEIFITNDASFHFVVRDCEYPGNFSSNGCISAQEYDGSSFSDSTEGTFCFCDTDLCLEPMADATTDHTSVFTVTETEMTSTESSRLTYLPKDELTQTLMSVATSFDVIQWSTMEPDTVDVTLPTSLTQTTSVGTLATLVQGRIDERRCLLCADIDRNGQCLDPAGYQTCGREGGGGEVCIFVNVSLRQDTGDDILQQMSAGCIDLSIFRFSVTNGCVSASEYIGVFQLDYSDVYSTGVACLCDSEDFCNGMSSLQFEKRDCHKCNGAKECSLPTVPVESCPSGEMCVAVNITIGDNPDTSIQMIRRGCEVALVGDRDCLSADDYIAMSSNIPLEVRPTEVTGRACFCSEELCNENINQENIESLIFLVQSQGLSDEVTLQWNILADSVNIDGFLVQVKLAGTEEWITVSPFLAPEEREFLIQGVIAADVRQIRVIAIDQSKHIVMESSSLSMRRVESGKTSQRTWTLGIIILTAVSTVCVVAILGLLGLRQKRPRLVNLFDFL